MTTIAYRAGVLAADTAMIQGYNMWPRSWEKIVKLPDGRLAGAAGDAGYAGAFLRWCLAGAMDGGEPEAKQDDGNMDRGMMVELDGKLRIFEPRGWFHCHPEYFAMGSGRDHAMGAMFVGADAEMAVRAGIEHDPGSGGDVMVLRLQSVVSEAA